MGSVSLCESFQAMFSSGIVSMILWVFFKHTHTLYSYHGTKKLSSAHSDGKMKTVGTTILKYKIVICVSYIQYGMSTISTISKRSS